MMLDRGYPAEFCEVITQNLNTDFTYRKKNWSVTTPSGMNTWQMAFLMTRSNAEIQIFYIYNNTPIDIT